MVRGQIDNSQEWCYPVRQSQGVSVWRQKKSAAVRIQQATMQSGNHPIPNSWQQTVVTARALLPSGWQNSSNPHQARRGFFVAFAYWFGFYYFGFRQSPPRTRALLMLT